MTEPLLLVDNSNTRTKFALVQNGRLVGARSCATSEICRETLLRTLAGWAYRQAALCSVAPAAAAILRAELGCPVHDISAGDCPRLLRSYPAPQTLGADRIANAAAVAAFYPLPCVAVDLGTACTFDLVTNAEGGPCFIGGAISPGLYTTARALAEKAACLSCLTPAQLRNTPPPGALGLNTQQAMLAGLRFGFCGMVAGVLSEMERELGERPCVVLTGGDADLFASSPTFEHIVDNALTMKGILHIYEHKNKISAAETQN